MGFVNLLQVTFCALHSMGFLEAHLVKESGTERTSPHHVRNPGLAKRHLSAVLIQQSKHPALRLDVDRGP